MSRDPSGSTTAAPGGGPRTAGETAGEPAGESAGERSSDSGGDLALLAAYVDGRAELSSDDQRRLEARLASDPAARAEQASLGHVIERLRALPPEGNAPDWSAMERSIRDAVGPELPRPWWRRGPWLVPSAALAIAAALVLAIGSRSAVPSAPANPAVADRAAPGRPAQPPLADRAAPGTGEVLRLWLDGAELDVDLAGSAGSTEAALAELTKLDELDQLADRTGSAGLDGELAAPDAESGEIQLLPSGDLAWLDQLDEPALDRAERWLARRKG
jgi:hypothetical protein